VVVCEGVQDAFPAAVVIHIFGAEPVVVRVGRHMSGLDGGMRLEMVERRHAGSDIVSGSGRDSVVVSSFPTGIADHSSPDRRDRIGCRQQDESMGDS
jgi:hypothetical protein